MTEKTPSLNLNGKCLICKSETVKLCREDNNRSVIEVCGNNRCFRGGYDFKEIKGWKIIRT